MLILSRRTGESLVIGKEITVKVLAVRGHRVKLGIEGPAEVPIHREEVFDLIEVCTPALAMAECA